MRRSHRVALIGGSVAIGAAWAGYRRTVNRLVEMVTETTRAQRWVHGLALSTTSTGPDLVTPRGGISDHPGQLTLTPSAGRGTKAQRWELASPRVGETNTKRRVLSPTQVVAPTDEDQNFSGAFSGHLAATPADLDLPYEDIELARTRIWSVPATVEQGTAEEKVWAIHLHGLTTTRSQTLRSVPTLSDLGIRSLIPDTAYSADRDEAPRRETLVLDALTEIRDVHRYAVQQGAAKVLYVGWSIGSLLALHLTTEPELRSSTAGLLLFSPVLNIRATVRKLLIRKKVPRVLACAMARSAAQRSGWEMVSEENVPHGSRPPQPPVPTLIFCGANDQQTLLEDTYHETAKNHPHAQISVIDQAHHTLEWNAAPERVSAHIVTWYTTQVVTDHQAKEESET